MRAVPDQWARMAILSSVRRPAEVVLAFDRHG